MRRPLLRDSGEVSLSLASFARRGRPETRSKEAATSELGCNFYSFIILIDDYDYGSTPFSIMLMRVISFLTDV